MKRHVLVVTVLILAAAIAPVLVGCGGSDTSKAHEYMKKGDELLTGMNTEGTKLEEEVTKLITTYSAGMNTEPAGVKAAVKEIEDLMAGLETKEKEAKADYEKILGLKGVPDYVEYANLRIEGIDKSSSINALINQMLDVIMKSVETGEAPDADKLVKDGQQLQVLTRQVVDLAEDADNLKEEKKL